MKDLFKHMSSFYLLASFITVLTLHILSKNGDVSPILVSKISLLLLGFYLLVNIIIFIIKLVIKKNKKFKSI